MSVLDEEGGRRASFYVLAPWKFDVPLAIAEAKRWMGHLTAIERRLAAIDRDILTSSEAEDWNRWNELQKEKRKLLVAREHQRRGIHEQREERPESEASEG
jgi:hypothetical protein